MSVLPPSLSRSTIVTALRSAGCVFAEDEAELILSTASSPAETAAMVRRRAEGLPLEHVLGWASFHGMRVAVDPGVFVPRRRSEFLVDQAAATLGNTWHGTGSRTATVARTATVTATGSRTARTPVVVDLCCGSGALGAALARLLGPVELHACDVEPAAVRCARRNLDGVGLAHEGDLFDALPAGLRGRIDVLLANVPYVPTGDVPLLPAEARDHEPRVALDGGEDGLDVMRRVVAAAPGWLAPGGSLLMETSERQADRALATVRDGGLDARTATSDELWATVVIGTRPR
ncbi:putative protein N(5)-glutamine methyltransferase [Streptomyces sp. NBC_00102]|uniref:putative protein N(5)-glutamine methyltransferase n=1 Tax=Streptomyces sp. NBC_00102 TaxID=2975652 RepID=UPI00225BDB80|nr:putative protein N(5)-glutamine methyltransferase [Streptomyces sp. NBC_00102]MCX5396624.1 putative protein N(5)-glutamine methyltransferase [Streptomyces sp. NBC_00102]